MIDYPGEILELGRSCIEKDARNTATMQMLWRGIALYIYHFDIKVMFGCAELPGHRSGAARPGDELPVPPSSRAARDPRAARYPNATST